MLEHFSHAHDFNGVFVKLLNDMTIECRARNWLINPLDTPCDYDKKEDTTEKDINNIASDKEKD